jgi:Protein of unknown function (DUF1592)/Protein of unknown function (DUF1588)/Protein of unknown function (DUF1595)/Protein of unknown function (DUF1585)
MIDETRGAVPGRRWLAVTVATCILLGAGCNGRIGPAGGGGGGGSGGGGDPTICTPAQAAACTGSEVQASKRIVRLTFNQFVNSVRSLLGTTIADQLANNANYSIVDATHRSFPPLSSPREGINITDNVWDTADRMAQDVAKYVFDNFGTVTSCTGANVTDTCAQNWVRGFAAKAYRRPLDAAETTEINKVYADVKALTGPPGTIQEATQYAVYAALSSPFFLYRTELGAEAASAMGKLTQYELASQLSYFLTDGPPDATLTAAAAANTLSTEAEVRAQVDRILATEAAKANLHGAMMSYFAIPTLESIVVQDPVFTNAVRSSMYHESELFLRDTLWGGKLAELLTATKSPINETLAPIYGVSWPPAGVTLDADGFGVAQLPATRAGMLTQGGFLVARARPMAGSVIGRGLLVNEALVCNLNPPFPEQLASEIEASNALLADATEQERAAYRADRSRACASCHPNFDAYGLALENFDTIARYREVDDKGRPIDARATLPPKLGCETVNGPLELAAKLTTTDAFAACMATNTMKYALAQTTGGTGTNSCATQAVIDRFKAAGEGTFASLVREIAVSQTLAVRNAGGAQ